MNSKLRLIIWILAIFLLSVFSGCIAPKNSEAPITIDLTKTENISYTETDDVLRIGVATMVSPKETLSVYNEIVDYIGKKLGKKTIIVQRPTYAQMNELVENKHVMAAFICSGPYVEGHEKFGMELLAAPQMYNDTVYYSYFIVNKDSTIKSFEELRGKKFAFTDPNSNSGKLVPIYVLGKMNETPDTFFKEYIFTGSHDNSIEAVSLKLVDGAAVDHLIWEYLNKNHPELTANTKIIEKHGPYGMTPFVTNPDTDPELKEKLRNILLNMDKDEEGKKILSKIEVQKFVVINDSSYESVREMVLWEKEQYPEK
jgi:phosphonate transport system substrate-binding protein